jgi:hypothetical protein
MNVRWPPGGRVDGEIDRLFLEVLGCEQHGSGDGNGAAHESSEYLHGVPLLWWW